jgi:hypothetical protein
MLDIQLLVPPLLGRRLGSPDAFLQFLGKTVEVH